jgi:hypothetical protein
LGALGLVDDGLAFAATVGVVALALGAGDGFAALGAAVSILAGAVSLAGASALATPIVLERVRWHVSHVTTVRTNVPSWCSSRRRLRGRPQKEHMATSVVTVTCPGLLFMPD